MTNAPTSADLTQPFGSYAEVLARWAAAQPEAVALSDDTGSITWRELEDRTGRIAARLLADGLERGEAVAILGTSSTAYALIFLAAVRAGGVAAPLTTSPCGPACRHAQTAVRGHIFSIGELAELVPDASRPE